MEVIQKKAVAMDSQEYVFVYGFFWVSFCWKGQVKSVYIRTKDWVLLRFKFSPLFILILFKLFRLLFYCSALTCWLFVLIVSLLIYLFHILLLLIISFNNLFSTQWQVARDEWLGNIPTLYFRRLRNLDFLK